MAEPAAVLADSGGVQKNRTYLGVSVFHVRANTEWPVTARHRTNVLVGLKPAQITEIPQRLAVETTAIEPPPLWDGKTSERTAYFIVG
jgi:UDP-N-acetylglucosamine 2-epimerase